MKARTLCLNVIVVAIILLISLACNFSNRVVENAISQTETARPTLTHTQFPSSTTAPTNTPEPSATLEPTQMPAEPTQPPAPAAPVPISLDDTILKVDDLNDPVVLFQPVMTETMYYGNGSCDSACLSREYRYAKNDYRLVINLALEESRESALAIVGNMAALAGSTGAPFLPIPESVTLGENPSLNAILNSDLIPNNFILLQPEPDDFLGMASVGPVLIELSLDDPTIGPIEAQEAAAILSYVMELQTLNVVVAYEQ